MTCSPRLVSTLALLVSLICVACQREPPLERGHSAAATSAVLPAPALPQASAQAAASAHGAERQTEVTPEPCDRRVGDHREPRLRLGGQPL